MVDLKLVDLKLVDLKLVDLNFVDLKLVDLKLVLSLLLHDFKGVFYCRYDLSTFFFPHCNQR